MEDAPKSTNKTGESSCSKFARIDENISISRKEAEKVADLRKVPESVKEIRIIDIQGFDRRPCKDDHVDNTSEIGKIKVTNRVGQDGVVNARLL